MKTSIPRLLIAVLLTLGAVRAHAQDAPWISDYNKALAQAKANNSDILMDFTGSDWCPWCIRMDKEVLSTKQFQDYVTKKNLVLMLVDFPQTKQLPQDVQDQNNKLQKQFNVDGYPTFILTDASGKILGQQVGYLEGGPAAFIALLDGFQK
jgi:thioredoxin-related protein